MLRILRYFTRPTLLAAERDRLQRGWADVHAHPRFTRLPANVRMPIIYNHAVHWEGWYYCVVLWPEEGIAWWMHVSFAQYRKLPVMMAHPDLYRW